MTNSKDYSGVTITNEISDNGDVTVLFTKGGINYKMTASDLKINFKNKTLNIHSNTEILNDSDEVVAKGKDKFLFLGEEEWPFFYGQTANDSLGLTISKHIANSIIQDEFGDDARFYDKETGNFIA